jgi:hypothetical protein
MRKLFCVLAVMLALPAGAQYGPSGQPTGLSTVGFQELAKTAALGASTSSANIAILHVSGVTQVQIQVYNQSTTATAFVIFCATSSCVASAGSPGTSTSDYPIAPGSVIVKTVPVGTTYAAAVLSTGSGTVYFTPGIGL